MSLPFGTRLNLTRNGLMNIAGAVFLMALAGACSHPVVPAALIPVNSTCRFSASHVEIRDVDQRPRVLDSQNPEFPERFSSMRSFVGSCVIEAIVSPDGSIIEPGVARADDVNLGNAAIAALTLWKFSPALKSGNPVGCRIRVPFIFSTKGPVSDEVLNAIGKQGDFLPYLVTPEDKNYRAKATRG